MTPLEAARAYAKRGWLVFPIRPEHKTPATQNGFLDATSDLAVIDKWWSMRRGWETRNIGIVTSSASGIWVLDCDIDKETGEDGRDTLDGLERDNGPLPPHPIASTPKGGKHHVFAWPTDGDVPRRIRFAPGLDALGSRMEDGKPKAGYFIVWPSRRADGDYSWDVMPKDVGIPLAPQWLVDMVRAEASERPADLPRIEPVRGDKTTPYGRKALDELCRDVSTCPPGSQSDTLIKRAARAGSLSAAGEIDEREAYTSLVDAGMRMTNGGKPWTQREISSAVRRGMAHGAKDPYKPRPMEPRRPPEAEPRPKPQLVTVDQVKIADPPKAPPDWMMDRPWSRNDDGKLKPKEAINCQLYIEHHPSLAGMFIYNRFTDKIIVTRGLPEDTRADYPRMLADADEAALTAWLNWHGIGPARGMVGDYIREVSFRHSFDPLQDWISALRWDGKPRIDRWLTYYAAAEDTPYIRMVGRKFLVSAAARALQPGCKVDTMLVLEGRQGIGKSTLAHSLFGEEFFSDQVGDVTSKDSAERIQGVWCVEIPEMDKFSRVEANAVKSYLSHRDDRYRPAYGRNAIIRPRRCVFLGTINPDGVGYLRDSTGNRRFWPVAVESVDLAGLAADRDQIWAEAVAAYRHKEEWWLSGEEEEVAKPEQDARHDEDVWEPRIAQWIEDRDPSSPTVRFTLGECLAGIGVDTPRQGGTEEKRARKILRALGCEPKNNQDGYKGRRFWRFDRK